MSQFHSSEWWGIEINRKVKEQEPENLHLDYKEKRSLLPPSRGGGRIDKQKRGDDISKDVSSFLNSDGGVLVYGVPETTDPSSTGGSPIPCDSDIGFEREEISKETIENLVTSNIQPRPGPELFQVTEVPYGNDGRLVFVVEVAVGVGEAWQAKDKKYYKRYEYKAEPMEHYEINMVRDRFLGPDLRLVFGLDADWTSSLWHTRHMRIEGNEVFSFMGIQNFGNEVAESALIEVCINVATGDTRWSGIYQGQFPEGVFPSGFQPIGIRKVKSRDQGVDRFLGEGLTVACSQLVWNPANSGLAGTYAPIFKTEDPFPVGKLNIGQGPTSHFPDSPFAYCLWRLQAPNMKTKLGIVEVYADPYRGISLQGNEAHWEFV